MRLRLMIETQEGVTWEQWRAIAAACERNGIEGLFASDHYEPVLTSTEDGSLDVWTTLAALAATTSSLRIGALVSPAGFRHPSNLARIVTTVDHVSGGRVELGLGTGSHPGDFAHFGFPYPSLGARMAGLAEHLEIIHRQWTEDEVSFDGEHYRLEHCRARPFPVQRPGPPIIVGGVAGPSTVAPAVRFASEYNTWRPTLEQVRGRKARVVAAAQQAGRAPSTLVYSVLTPAVLGASASAVRDSVRAVMDAAGAPGEPDDFMAANGDVWIFGTVDEARRRVAQLVDAGAERIYLDHRHYGDVDAIELFGQLAEDLAA
jgi:alkanesulfonate monooxygenase SsuD/methylene tetrahydromethanopterin reductase-like flavin-dependent oxidoreductase (luciferase family)